MDEVLEKFNTSLGHLQSEDEQKHKFEGLYKNWGRLGNQEDRRRELLDVQKQNRNNKLDKYRGILEIVDAVEDRLEWQNCSRARYRPSIYVAGFNKASESYRDVLMQSEWMIEKPEDFHDNWYVVPCPKGTRVLLVANRGITKCYSKYGHFLWECRTALPGGNPCEPKQRVQCCVLDCFWQEKNNTMYVLDLLAWNSQPMTDGEMEFRHYWLITQLSDFPALRIKSKRNEVIFSMLPKVPCDQNSFNQFMMKYPAFDGGFPLLDGLLFYHKRAHYVGGETPLVGWLYPYMVHEVIGFDVTVNDCYLMARPAGYVDQADFIQKFEEKYSKKNKSRRSSISSNTSSNTKNSSSAKNEDSTVKSSTSTVKEEAMEEGESETSTVEKMEDGSANNSIVKSPAMKEDTMEEEKGKTAKVEKMEDGSANNSIVKSSAMKEDTMEEEKGKTAKVEKMEDGSANKDSVQVPESVEKKLENNEDKME